MKLDTVKPYRGYTDSKIFQEEKNIQPIKLSLVGYTSLSYKKTYFSVD